MEGTYTSMMKVVAAAFRKYVFRRNILSWRFDISLKTGQIAYMFEPLT
jgi:hypothetical protein